jgi:hypothetical protein
MWSHIHKLFPSTKLLFPIWEALRLDNNAHQGYRHHCRDARASKGGRSWQCSQGVTHNDQKEENGSCHLSHSCLNTSRERVKTGPCFTKPVKMVSIKRIHHHLYNRDKIHFTCLKLVQNVWIKNRIQGFHFYDQARWSASFRYRVICFQKCTLKARHQWLMIIILARWEAEIRRTIGK